MSSCKVRGEFLGSDDLLCVIAGRSDKDQDGQTRYVGQQKQGDKERGRDCTTVVQKNPLKERMPRRLW